MPKPLSVDLRGRITGYVAGGHSRRQAAKRFGVGVSSAIRYAAQYEATGDVTPRKLGGDRRSKLGPHREYLLGRVEAEPDITLAELTAELAARGVTVHLSNVCRFLRAQGLTFKKNSGRH